jgi:hypothetical protein
MNENARNKTALVVLEEVALAARRAAEQAAEQDDAFANGLLVAYVDVLTVIMEQVEVLGLDPAGIGLGGFEPYALYRSKQVAENPRRGSAAASAPH